MFADLALIAVATEAIIGYPDAVYRLAGHPVTWIGRLITWCDEAWNSPTLPFEVRRWRGVDTLAEARRTLHGTLVCVISAVLVFGRVSRHSNLWTPNRITWPWSRLAGLGQMAGTLVLGGPAGHEVNAIEFGAAPTTLGVRTRPAARLIGVTTQLSSAM